MPTTVVTLASYQVVGLHAVYLDVITNSVNRARSLEYQRQGFIPAVLIPKGSENRPTFFLMSSLKNNEIIT